MGGCQNYGPFLGTLNIRCRILIGIQKGTLIDNHPHNLYWGLKDPKSCRDAEVRGARLLAVHGHGGSLLSSDTSVVYYSIYYNSSVL